MEMLCDRKKIKYHCKRKWSHVSPITFNEKKNLCLPLEKKKTEIRKGVPQCLSLAKRLKKKEKEINWSPVSEK
jgi:hypothetical protein